MPFTVLLGGALYLFYDLLRSLQLRVTAAIGHIQAAFLMFFLFFLTLVALYFLLLAWPVGYLLETFADKEMAMDYRRWSLDLAAVQALISWAWAAFRRSLV